MNKTDKLLKSVMVLPDGYRLAKLAIAMIKDLNERLKTLEEPEKE